MPIFNIEYWKCLRSKDLILSLFLSLGLHNTKLGKQTLKFNQTNKQSSKKNGKENNLFVIPWEHYTGINVDILGRESVKVMVVGFVKTQI